MHRELAGDIRISLLIVMSYDYDKLVAGYSAEGIHDDLCTRTVQITCRLICYDDRGILGQSTGDSHPLLLSAGELGYFRSPVIAESYKINQFQDSVSALLPLLAGKQHNSFDILIHRIAVDQVEILEYVAYICFTVSLVILCSVCRSILTAHEHLTFFIGVKSGYDVEQSRLTTAALACDRHEFADVQVKIDTGKTHADRIFSRVILRYLP